MTESVDDLDQPVQTRPKWGSILLIGVIALAAALAVVVGTRGTTEETGDDSSAETTPQVSYGMAGAPQDVIVSRAALESTPAPWVLDSPESAVRSYLDWISYGYRTAQPAFSEPTMGEEEAVRIDAYNEYNLQKQRIIDQTLTSITFGEPQVAGTTATIGTSEVWTYRYVSISEPGVTIDGPFEARYDSIYSLVQTDGSWVVQSVDVTRLDESQ